MTDIEPRLRIRANDLISFGQIHSPRLGRKKGKSGLISGSEKRPYSLFCNGSRKRLKNQLANYTDTIQLARTILKEKRVKPLNKHTFITLTLPSSQMHCDKVIKRKILDQFISELKEDYNFKNYIWKAEVQKNGNLHFHVLTDIYIDAMELMLIWNYHTNKLGHIDHYYQRSGKILANSTDIHSLQKIRNVTAYVGKYMSKSETVRPVCGHTWGRSDQLSKMIPYIFHEDAELAEWHNMTSNSISNWKTQGELWSFERFDQRFNLTTLPSKTMAQLKEIVKFNLECIGIQ